MISSMLIPSSSEDHERKILKYSEWVIVVELQLGNFSATLWGEQVECQWNDDEIRFVPDQHA